MDFSATLTLKHLTSPSGTLRRVDPQPEWSDLQQDQTFLTSLPGVLQTPEPPPTSHAAFVVDEPETIVPSKLPPTVSDLQDRKFKLPAADEPPSAVTAAADPAEAAAAAIAPARVSASSASGSAASSAVPRARVKPVRAKRPSPKKAPAKAAAPSKPAAPKVRVVKDEKWNALRTKLEVRAWIPFCAPSDVMTSH